MGEERNEIRVGSAAIIENPSGKILMAKRKIWPKGMWVLPGGGVKFGETSKDALTRELKEETGIEVSSPDFLTVYELIVPENNVHRVIFYYKVKVNDAKNIRPSSDVEELRWFEPNEIPELENLGHATIPVLKIAGYLK